MSSRLLLVEPSATMRYVLENYAQSLGFGVVAVGDYNLAEDALREQFRSYGNDFACVLLGWPIVSDESSDSLIALLDSPDFADMPVVVMSTDMRAETRAWVAGREDTAVLPWKEYQGLKVMLQRLLEPARDDRDVFDTKFDNSDIHILIVDDSVSIRFALRDLFELQGYKISVASGHDEALTAAKAQRFDIGILDFYLQDGTGDTLCRQLLADPATGQIACAILTGTYADHIIKRSLRAGAVECMFKNESSELILARIDALSRFVRQRKQVAQEQNRLDSIIDTLAGATIVVDETNSIRYISEQASSVLGFDDRSQLIGQPAAQIIDVKQLRASSEGKFRAQWRDAAQGLIHVVCRQVVLEGGRDCVLNFKLMPAGSTADSPTAAAGASSTTSSQRIEQQIMANVKSAAVVSSGSGGIGLSSADLSKQLSEAVPQASSLGRAQQVVSQLNLMPQASEFIATLIDYPAKQSEMHDFVSLLLIDVFATSGDDSLSSVDYYDGLSKTVYDAFLDVYKRENHVARLGANRFGFLLRHTTQPQAYLLTRKIMQICNGIDTGRSELQIKCTGCLTSVSDNGDQEAQMLLSRVSQGLDIVNTRGANQALLLDLRRMLPVYAAKP